MVTGEGAVKTESDAMQIRSGVKEGADTDKIYCGGFTRNRWVTRGGLSLKPSYGSAKFGGF